MTASRITAAAVHHLATGRAVTLDSAVGRCLKSVEGTLWITLGDQQDIVLAEGTTLGIGPQTHPVVTALGSEARLAIVDCPQLSKAA